MKALVTVLTVLGCILICGFGSAFVYIICNPQPNSQHEKRQHVHREDSDNVKTHST